jgi:hypothetical protein
MRLSTRTHGLFDFGTGVLLILAHAALGWGGGGPGGWALSIAGALLILSTLLTSFEFGVRSILQIPLHLWLDGLIGLVLAISPWVFAFYRTIWIPHVALGVVIMIAAFLTDTVPGYDRRTRARVAP